MKLFQTSSKRTREQAKKILGDFYTEELWENLLSLDVTPTQKHLPVLSRFVKEFPFSEVVKYYRLFNNSKIRETSLDQFNDFESFMNAVDQSPSNLTKYWDELNAMDVTTSKMHVNDLLRLMKDGGMSIHQMEYYYRTYASSDLSLEKPLSSYTTFRDFEHDIDALGGVVGDDMSDEVVPPIYTDENVRVYLGDSQNKCIELSKGYTFCIGRPDSSNMYASYRLKDSTFYFVRFAKDNDYIVVHALPNDKYKYTKSGNDGDYSINKEKLIELYPDIGVLFENGILERKPLTALEQATLRRVDDVTFQGFNYDTKTAYLSAGHNLTDAQFDMIDKHQKNLYINSLSGVLSREQFLKIQDTPLGSRYITLVKRNMEKDVSLFSRLPDAVQQDERMGDLLLIAKTGWINEIEKSIKDPNYFSGDLATMIPQGLLSDPDILKSMKEWLLREAKKNPDMRVGGGFLLVPLTVPPQLADDEDIRGVRIEGYKEKLKKEPMSYRDMDVAYKGIPDLQEIAKQGFIDFFNSAKDPKSYAVIDLLGNIPKELLSDPKVKVGWDRMINLYVEDMRNEYVMYKVHNMWRGLSDNLRQLTIIADAYADKCVKEIEARPYAYDEDEFRSIKNHKGNYRKRLAEARYRGLINYLVENPQNFPNFVQAQSEGGAVNRLSVDLIKEPEVLESARAYWRKSLKHHLEEYGNLGDVLMEDPVIKEIGMGKLLADINTDAGYSDFVWNFNSYPKWLLEDPDYKKAYVGQTVKILDENPFWYGRISKEIRVIPEVIEGAKLALINYYENYDQVPFKIKKGIRRIKFEEIDSDPRVMSAFDKARSAYDRERSKQQVKERLQLDKAVNDYTPRNDTLEEPQANTWYSFYKTSTKRP